MEIKIDIKGSSVELETFLHSLTINLIAARPKRPLKRQIRRKKDVPRKSRRQPRNRPRRMTFWMIRKWPTSERTFSGEDGQNE